MRRYEIVWVPIPSSITSWTDKENKVFKHLSEILPWYSIRQPSRVNSAVVNYLKHVSGFVGEPVMVVVDQNGRLANLNAMHMVHIWGPSAYLFTASREEKLWEEVNWFGQLIADEIDPLLSKQVEEGRICLFGSSDINWVRELSRRIKEMTKTGLQLDLIYVGKRRLNDDQHVSNIISTITQEKLSSYLAYPKMHFFWLRMENIKRSEIKLGKKATKAEHILKNVGSLVNFDDCEKSWALFGERFSKDILHLQGRKLMECLRLFQVWGENIEKVGFMAAIRCALEPPMASLEPCYICNVSEFIQGNQKEEGIVLCEECKRPMKMFSVYQCNAVE
ncbi:protein SIEVE ELEMENT OCCLUSION C-like [Papaver somniferum]|uniref:protein SIEVE ELEMENT OCCLUSION C-like n=1 Tax=Papaver somniferum TaxID=3469 RepID=UPI000E6FF17E|nr:protein SIEVE ELEMENT OCCLUSION C-like [Papaver somniferum]XP_026442358.1 protein SIEVE ELEMENT OCCLUSION C-like [Papaver somniferum]XP_026442359.1 protein SIEVE ELEMENT OCCLUSION C-like [Papaver somniferum]